MSQTIFQVRHDLFASLNEESKDRAVVNRMGSAIVTDLFTQLILSGYAYHIQAGTEAAGIASTGAISDTTVSILADNSANFAMLPLLFEVNPGVHGGATIAQAMLEVDKDIVRYNTGGTAYVPANLRTDDDKTASGTFYVGPDITAEAKSAVPNSVELARKNYTEDALADTIGYPGAWDAVVYSIATRPPCFLIDASSIVGHVGTAGTDFTGYWVLQFAQFSKNLVV